MTTLAACGFLALLAATLVFGGWLGARLSRADTRIDGMLIDAERDEAINDEAENGWAR